MEKEAYQLDRLIFSLNGVLSENQLDVTLTLKQVAYTRESINFQWMIEQFQNASMGQISYLIKMNDKSYITDKARILCSALYGLESPFVMDDEMIGNSLAELFVLLGEKSSWLEMINTTADKDIDLRRKKADLKEMEMAEVCIIKLLDSVYSLDKVIHHVKERILKDHTKSSYSEQSLPLLVTERIDAALASKIRSSPDLSFVSLANIAFIFSSTSVPCTFRAVIEAADADQSMNPFLYHCIEYGAFKSSAGFGAQRLLEVKGLIGSDRYDDFVRDAIEGNILSNPVSAEAKNCQQKQYGMIYNRADAVSSLINSVWVAGEKTTAFNGISAKSESKTLNVIIEEAVNPRTHEHGLPAAIEYFINNYRDLLLYTGDLWSRHMKVLNEAGLADEAIDWIICLCAVETDILERGAEHKVPTDISLEDKHAFSLRMLSGLSKRNVSLIFAEMADAFGVEALRKQVGPLSGKTAMLFREEMTTNKDYQGDQNFLEHFPSCRAQILQSGLGL